MGCLADDNYRTFIIACQGDRAGKSKSETGILLQRYEKTGPEVHLPHHRNNEETLKGLETLVDILSHSNERLANIARLSLGNPKSQSLNDTFVVVSGILKKADPLVEKLTTLNIPCVSVFANSMDKAAEIADVSKPCERQVEKLKRALGECDGLLFIAGKYIFG